MQVVAVVGYGDRRLTLPKHARVFVKENVVTRVLGDLFWECASKNPTERPDFEEILRRLERAPGMLLPAPEADVLGKAAAAPRAAESGDDGSQRDAFVGGARRADGGKGSSRPPVDPFQTASATDDDVVGVSGERPRVRDAVPRAAGLKIEEITDAHPDADAEGSGARLKISPVRRSGERVSLDEQRNQWRRREGTARP
jgi:hypothetical protein